MELFIRVVIPVLAIFVAGYLFQSWKRIDIRSVSSVAIYVFTPCLVFRTFYTAELNIQYLLMVIFSFILLFSLIVINKLYTQLKKHSQKTESGFILATAFMNSGNYGAPIVLFAYGEEGFLYSVSFLVLQAIIMNLFGVYYAARGESGVQSAITSVFQMPPTYAVILALLFQLLDFQVPENIVAVIDMVGIATIPLVMIILGMQLAEIKLQNFEWGKITYGVFVRMIASPLLAFGILLFLPVDELLKKVLILSAAMPSAATTVMYAVQFETEPDLVSSITLITTLVSIITITILLSLLG